MPEIGKFQKLQMMGREFLNRFSQTWSKQNYIEHFPRQILVQK